MVMGPVQGCVQGVVDDRLDVYELLRKEHNHENPTDYVLPTLNYRLFNGGLKRASCWRRQRTSDDRRPNSENQQRKRVCGADCHEGNPSPGFEWLRCCTRRSGAECGCIRLP